MTTPLKPRPSPRIGTPDVKGQVPVRTQAPRASQLPRQELKSSLPVNPTRRSSPSESSRLGIHQRTSSPSGVVAPTRHSSPSGGSRLGIHQRTSSPSGVVAPTANQLVKQSCQKCDLNQKQTAELQMKLKKAEAENAALRQQRDIDQQELETLRKKRDEEEQLKQQRDLEMSDALARLETELILAREDAAAVGQVNEEDNVDGDTICILFSDLVTNIDDLVFGVFEQLSLAEVTSPIVVDRKVFAATDANIINTIWPFLVSVMGSRPTVDTVAVPAMRCIASSILYSQILQPFYPINTDFNGDGCFEGLMQLWSSVAEQETQEVMGRWRSIAYRAVRHPQADDDDFLENMAKQLLTSLRDVMVLLLPQRLSASRDWEQLIDLLMPHALEVLRKANDFQSITQGQCVSWDYMVYHPPSNRTFHGDTMDVDTEVLEDHAAILERHPVDESRLLLATSLGLQAHRKTMDLQETIVVQKAKAVAARSSTS